MDRRAFHSRLFFRIEESLLQSPGHFSAVTLGVFCDVHGGVGSAQQAISAGAVFGIECDADACSAAEHVTLDSKWSVKTAFQPLRYFFDRGAAARYWNQCGKFIATETGKHIS